MKRANKICLIAPTEQLAESAREIIARKGYPIDVFVAYLETAQKLAKELVADGVEVFISRKGTIASLEKCVDVPVVRIESSISDYVMPMKHAKEIKGKIAFFSYEKLSDDLWALCDMLNIDARAYYFTSVADSENCVRRALKDGCIFAIGGASTREASARLGLEHIIFENPESSILHAMESALQILEIRKEEERKQLELKLRLERYEMIFNYTHDAIVAVNGKGEIDVMNSAAEKIVEYRDGSPIGKPVDMVLKNTKLPEVLKNGVPQLNELMKIGDTLVSANRLPIKVGNKILGAVAAFQDVKKIQDSEKEIRYMMYKKGHVAKYQFQDILGESEAIKNVKRIAYGYSLSDSTILIYGETGTGKELFAQSIHNASNRKNAQFVAVNCASLPKNLLEAELFGYEEGAFTGASKKGKPGLFEIAHGGTIFLDEISEISVETQLQLLRVLQEKEIRRIGSDKVMPVDIRVISATNRSLADEIKKNRFRRDLYYRLNVLNIEIPPLRERGEDIFIIGLGKLRKMARKKVPEMERKLGDVLTLAWNYTWPGNVRELDNFVERLYVLMSQGYEEYRIEDMVKQLLDHTIILPADSAKAADNDLDTWAKREIVNALKRHNLSIAKAAADLGMSRTTLWRRMKKYHITMKREDESDAR